jgi:hypothetical protein
MPPTSGIDSAAIEASNQPTVDVNENALDPKMDKDKFRIAAKNKIADEKKYWDQKKYTERAALNVRYWNGDQLDLGNLSKSAERNSDNVIFRDLETFIPIATARTPEWTATPVYKNEKTRAFSDVVRRGIKAEWSVYQNMQPLLSRGVRNHNLHFIGIFQYGHDPDTDEFWTEEFPATDCVIGRDGDFFARYVKNKKLGWYLDTFPEAKTQILSSLGYSTLVEPSQLIRDSDVTAISVFTPDLVGWILNDITISLKKNPNWDYEGKEYAVPPDPNAPAPQPTVDPATGQLVPPQQQTQKVYFNYFKKPKIPFLFLVYWNRGIHVLDETTIVEQAIGPQNWVNKRKRQIGLNADSTNGHWVTSGDYISKDEFGKLEGTINEKIWLEKGKPADGFIKLTGEPLPDYIYNDLIDSRSEIDNLMGTHSTTRGERSGNNTATQDMSAKDSDYGRVDGYIRDGIENFAKRWAEAMYHMMLVYRSEDTMIAIPDDNDLESENVVFAQDRVPLILKKNGELIPVPLLFTVQQGSTLPEDEVFKAAQAEKNKDILSPIDLLRLEGYANPRELTKNFLLWTNDPFAFFPNDPEIQALQQKMQMQAAAQAQAQAAQGEQVHNQEMQKIAAKQSDKENPAETQSPSEEKDKPTGPSDKGVANALSDIAKKHGTDLKTVISKIG